MNSNPHVALLSRPCLVLNRTQRHCAILPGGGSKSDLRFYTASELNASGPDATVKRSGLPNWKEEWTEGREEGGAEEAKTNSR